MEEEIDSREVNTELSNKCSMDLLQHFPAEIRRKDEYPSDESEDIELNLGLSLGGCFGVDTCKNRLARSSSIGGISILQRDSDSLSSSAASLSIVDSLMMRASSLPTQADEERRKRREMQSLRRMEAKRKRTEKQRNSWAASGASLERSCVEHKRVEEGGLIAVSVFQNNGRTQGITNSYNFVNFEVIDLVGNCVLFVLEVLL